MKNLVFPFPGLERLFAIYAELEEQIAHFKRVAHIDCLDKCQKCCERAKRVETSAFEMLPLSIHLWGTGNAELFLEQLTKVDPEVPCVLWDRNSSLSSEGGCRYYFFRPIVCRLFGFSAFPDKYGSPRIALCKPLKERNPGIEDHLNEMIQHLPGIPIMPHYTRRVALLDPNFGQRLNPINRSLRQALEIVGYRMQFQKEPRT